MYFSCESVCTSFCSFRAWTKLVLPQTRSLYAGSDSGVVQSPTAFCGRYLSCDDCVLTRDPYCAWDPRSAACVNIHDAPSQRHRWLTVKPRRTTFTLYYSYLSFYIPGLHSCIILQVNESKTTISKHFYWCCFQSDLLFFLTVYLSSYQSVCLFQTVVTTMLLCFLFFSGGLSRVWMVTQTSVLQVGVHYRHTW